MLPRLQGYYYPLLAVVLVCTTLLGAQAAGSDEDNTVRSTTMPPIKPLEVVNREDLMRVVTCDVHAPRPTVIIFLSSLDPSMSKTLSDVRRRISPSIIPFFWGYLVQESDDELMSALIGTRRAPTMGLFCSKLGRASPDAPVMHIPEFYEGTDSIAEMMQWLLSRVPMQYLDEKTNKLVSASHVVSTKDDVNTVLSSLDRLKALPQAVVVAYMHISVLGSHMYMAGLASISTQTGGRVVTIFTESKSLARDLGLSQLDTATSFTVESLRQGLGSNTVPSALTPIRELKYETAADYVVELNGPLLPREDEANMESLVSWRAALEVYDEATVLPTFTSRQHLQLELSSIAVKIIFFLRPSDEAFFGSHFKLAQQVAAEARRRVMTFTDKTGKTRTWKRDMLVRVFWVNAERQPEFASQLEMKTAPAVAVLLPLRGDDPNQVEVTTAGVHFINYMDLNLSPDGDNAPALRTAADARHVFPGKANDMIRLVACPAFFPRMQTNMHSLKINNIRWSDAVSPLESEAASTYIRDVLTGVVTLPRADAVAASDDLDDDDVNKAKPKVEVSEEKKKKWREEVEARKRAKAARTKSKAKQDASARGKAAKELKQQALEEAAAEARKKSQAPKVLKVPRPLPPKGKGGRRSAVSLERLWKEDGERVAAQYVYRRGRDVVTHSTLEV